MKDLFNSFMFLSSAILCQLASLLTKDAVYWFYELLQYVIEQCHLPIPCANLAFLSPNAYIYTSQYSHIHNPHSYIPIHVLNHTSHPSTPSSTFPPISHNRTPVSQVFD